MKIMYFLTAVFENKFGKADKYYDEKGWHWLLSSDKPILFNSTEEAKSLASELEKDLVSEIKIKEIQVYDSIFEHKIAENTGFIPRDIIFEIDDSENYVFLSKTKQLPNAQRILGLYRVDRKSNFWIYGSETIPSLNIDELIEQSYCSLSEAKKLMSSNNFPPNEIIKIDGVLLFVKRLNNNIREEKIYNFDNLNNEELILKSYSFLLEAKKLMTNSNFSQNEIIKIDGVMNFVKKLI